jgi:phosphoadenosine phosphosulfate reductase
MPTTILDHDQTVALVTTLTTQLQGQQPLAVMERAYGLYGDDLVVSFSGAEDVLLLDLAVQIAGSSVRVMTLDTGRLHVETYAYLEDVRASYGIRLEVFSPEAQDVERLVAEKGLFSFRRDGHKECCGIRKVAPLRRALAGRRAWATGQRRDQSPDTRAAVPVVELDVAFGRPDQPLVKFNPLAAWTSAQVWRYLRGAGIPTNPLHSQGYISIGCAPCTRATLPGEHERAGRWWWEEATMKECGLHAPAAADDEPSGEAVQSALGAAISEL